MQTRLVEQGDGTLHGLHGYLLGIVGVKAHLDASFCHCTEKTHDVGDAATCHHHACIHQSLGDDLALPYPLEELCGLVCLLGFLNKGHALAELGCSVGHGIDVDAIVANACGDGDDEFACQLRRNLRDDLLYEPGLHGKQDDICALDGFAIVERDGDARTC